MKQLLSSVSKSALVFSLTLNLAHAMEPDDRERSNVSRQQANRLLIKKEALSLEQKRGDGSGWIYYGSSLMKEALTSGAEFCRTTTYIKLVEEAIDSFTKAMERGHQSAHESLERALNLQEEYEQEMPQAALQASRSPKISGKIQENDVLRVLRFNLQNHCKIELSSDENKAFQFAKTQNTAVAWGWYGVLLTSKTQAKTTLKGTSAYGEIIEKAINAYTKAFELDQNSFGESKSIIDECYQQTVLLQDRHLDGQEKRTASQKNNYSTSTTSTTSTTDITSTATSPQISSLSNGRLEMQEDVEMGLFYIGEKDYASAKICLDRAKNNGSAEAKELLETHGLLPQSNNSRVPLITPTTIPSMDHFGEDDLSLDGIQINPEALKPFQFSQAPTTTAMPTIQYAGNPLVAMGCSSVNHDTAQQSSFSAVEKRAKEQSKEDKLLETYALLLQSNKSPASQTTDTTTLSQISHMDEVSPEDDIAMGQFYIESNDLESAEMCLLRAEKNGSEEADLPLGQLYIKKDDLKSAQKYLLRALVKGSEDARDLLQIYCPQQKDLNKAYYYLIQAATGGHKQAISKLRQTYLRLQRTLYEVISGKFIDLKSSNDPLTIQLANICKEEYRPVLRTVNPSTLAVAMMNNPSPILLAFLEKANEQSLVKIESGYKMRDTYFEEQILPQLAKNISEPK